MTHQEYVYLLYKARLLEDVRKAQAAKGETFVPSNHFDPITAPIPCEAQARIESGTLMLRLRVPADVPAPTAPVVAAALVFFGGVPFDTHDAVVADGYATYRFSAATPPRP